MTRQGPRLASADLKLRLASVAALLTGSMDLRRSGFLRQISTLKP